MELVASAMGISDALNCRAVGRVAGAQIRTVLPALYANAVPSIYICGGCCRAHGVLASMQRLHAGGDAWEALPPMPTARRLCAAAVARGHLYIFGGEVLWSVGSTIIFRGEGVRKEYYQLDTAERYSPLRGEWEQLPPMPTARAGCAAAAVGGLLYVVGGRVGEKVRNNAERFDPATCRWEALPVMPSARSGCAAAHAAGFCYALGGKCVDGRVGAVAERFDPQVGRWQKLPPMRLPRSAFAAEAIAGVVYALGGFNGSVGVGLCERFDAEAGCWEPLPAMLSPRVGGAAAVAGGRLFVFGGKAGEPEKAAPGECFDPGSWVWNPLPVMEARQVYCAGAALVDPGSPLEHSFRRGVVAS